MANIAYIIGGGQGLIAREDNVRHGPILARCDTSVQELKRVFHVLFSHEIFTNFSKHALFMNRKQFKINAGFPRKHGGSR